MELCPHLLPSMECILILSKNPILTKVFSQNNFLQNCCFSAQNYFFHIYNSIVSGFENFSENYRKELEGNSDFKEFEDIILEELKKGNVTMVYASKTPELSHIPVLKEFIEEKLRK